jgi:hypothetical protein
MGATYLYDLADTLLTAAEAALDPTRTGVTVPGYTYVSHDDPVADLEGCCSDTTEGDEDVYGGGILTVSLGSPDGDPLDFTPPTGQCQMSTLANFTVTLLRCVPALDDDGAPPPAELNASARRLLVDLWCLTTGLRDARRQDIWPSGVVCKSFTFTNTRALAPLGGCGGWQITVQVATNDPGPQPAS